MHKAGEAQEKAEPRGLGASVSEGTVCGMDFESWHFDPDMIELESHQLLL